MSSHGKSRTGATRLQSDRRSRIIAAYREGSGLVGIAIICDAAGIRIDPVAPNADSFGAAKCAQARWWCRCPLDAQTVASDAATRVRRRESREKGATSSAALLAQNPPALTLASETVLAAARRRNIALYSDDEITEAALRVAAHIDDVMEKLKRNGGMRTINKSYRECRLASRERGKRVEPYGEWLWKYKENLVREAAKVLRDN